MPAKEKVKGIIREIEKRLDQVDEDPLQWAVVAALLVEAGRGLRPDDRMFDGTYRDLLGLGCAFEDGLNKA